MNGDGIERALIEYFEIISLWNGKEGSDYQRSSRMKCGNGPSFFITSLSISISLPRKNELSAYAPLPLPLSLMHGEIKARFGRRFIFLRPSTTWHTNGRKIQAVKIIPTL